MNKFESNIEYKGTIEFPKFSNKRILMMPFYLQDITSLPRDLHPWIPFVRTLVMKYSPCKNGIGYLTIDECSLKAGDTHRRPGLHVDGWMDEGNAGFWGGGGGWGSSIKGQGMLLVASHVGSRGWNQKFEGQPNKYGDCEHLRKQLDPFSLIEFEPNQVYRLEGLTVHESIPVSQDCKRQFVRLSMPSKANWNSSNTPNPWGIQPEGPIVKPRPDEFTTYGNKYGT